MSFHQECRELALEMFGKLYSDLSDDECRIVAKTVRKRRSSGSFWERLKKLLVFW